MIYYLAGIIIVSIISYLFNKNIIVFLRYTSMITIISGYLVIIFNYFLKQIINREISYINISKITDIVYRKSIERGLVLVLIGGIELIGYILILSKKRIINQ